MRLVIFDIDGTLVSGASSEVRLSRYLWRRGVLGPRQLLAFSCFPLRYFPRYGRHVMQKNKAWLTGHERAHIASQASCFVAEDLVFNEPVLARLRAHQRAGDSVTLLSGTPQFLADAIGAALGVEHCIGAVCAIENGYFTSAPPRRHPYGPTKVDAAALLAEVTGLPLAEAVAYGDSVNDVPLFNAVGEAVAVAPGRRLRTQAAASGWEVLGGARSNG